MMEEDAVVEVADDVVGAEDEVVDDSGAAGVDLEVGLVVNGGLGVVDEGVGTGTVVVVGVDGPPGKVAPDFVMTVIS